MVKIIMTKEYLFLSKNNIWMLNTTIFVSIHKATFIDR